MIANGMLFRKGEKVEPSQLFTRGGRWYLPSANLNGRALFVIVADFCGHCHKLADTINDIARKFPLTTYYVENTDPHADMIMRRMGVTAFPAIFKIRTGGELVPYRGPRDEDGLLSLPYF
jgi:glutaredoxin